MVDAQELDRFAAKANAAFARAVHAREHLDQGRFASAVLAEEDMHFAGAQLEIDRVERQYAGELLGYGLGLQNRRRRGRPRADAFRRRHYLRSHHIIKRPNPADVN